MPNISHDNILVDHYFLVICYLFHHSCFKARIAVLTEPSQSLLKDVFFQKACEERLGFGTVWCCFGWV